jgi:hypothetical protein
MPNRNAHTSSCGNECAYATRNVGIAVASSSPTIRIRPPTLSVRMPSGSRQIDPLRMAMAVSHENWTVSRCSSSLIGTPRTPNISHTANSRVKAIVERVRTRAEGFIASCIGPGQFRTLLAIVGPS